MQIYAYGMIWDLCCGMVWNFGAFLALFPGESTVILLYLSFMLCYFVTHNACLPRTARYVTEATWSGILLSFTAPEEAADMKETTKTRRLTPYV